MRLSPTHTVRAASAAALLMAFGPADLAGQPSTSPRSETGRSRNAPAQQTSNKMGAPGQESVTRYPTVRANTSATVRPPAADTRPAQPRLSGGGSADQLRSTMVSSSRRIDEAIRAGRLDAAVREAEAVEKHSGNLSTRKSDYPVSCKFLVPSLHQSYTEGVRLIREGHRGEDHNKMRLGLERIDNANRNPAWDAIEKATRPDNR